MHCQMAGFSFSQYVYFINLALWFQMWLLFESSVSSVFLPLTTDLFSKQKGEEGKTNEEIEKCPKDESHCKSYI